MKQSNTTETPTIVKINSLFISPFLSDFMMSSQAPPRSPVFAFFHANLVLPPAWNLDQLARRVC